MTLPSSQDISLQPTKNPRSSGQYQIPMPASGDHLQMIECSVHLINEPGAMNLFIGMGDNERVPLIQRCSHGNVMNQFRSREAGVNQATT